MWMTNAYPNKSFSACWNPDEDCQVDRSADNTNLRQCSITYVAELSTAPLNQSAWRARCHDSVAKFESSHTNLLSSKRANRKGSVT